MNYKEQFKTIYQTYIKREGSDKLLEMLEKSDFYLAPASTKHHESYEGGLVEHSVNVYSQLIFDHTTEKSTYTMETLAIVSLLHDLCKVGYYKVDYRNNKNEQGKWEKVPYYTVDDKFPMGHGEKSVYLIERFMKLTDEEAMAIRWHMGAYSGQQDWSTLSKAYTDYPLTLLTHIADMKATYIDNETR